MAPSKKETLSKKDRRAWDALTPPLAEWILEAVSSMGFSRMTPVQTDAIPLFLKNRDVVVEAVTGSGKTLSFLLPIVQKLLSVDEPTKRHHVGAIIVSPTRELATQIHQVLLSLLPFHPPSAAVLPLLDEDEKRPQTAEPVIVSQLIVGGSTTVSQDLGTFLRNSPNVLVATPGRLVELLSSPHVHCPQSSFEVLVLDEADRLLDLGFKQDLQRILSFLPKQRRTGLFSASISEAVGEIIRLGLRYPVKITVRVKSLATGGVIEEKKTPASLQLRYLVRPTSHMFPTLVKLLEKLDPRPQKTIIFLSTCAAVDYFQHMLPFILPKDFTLVSLHGKLAPNARVKNFQKFSTSISPTILLATDVAARGLDIPQVDLVVQTEPPKDPKVFIHRSGRAGRAGRRGLSIVFLRPGREEREYVPFMNVRKTPIELLQDPDTTVTDLEVSHAVAQMREAVKGDRALFDKAQRGFVSWVRAFSTHAAVGIFRVSDLDWEDLANAWALLRIPKMPELKKWPGDKTLGGITQSIDWDIYAYKDKAREKKRKAEMVEQAEARANDTPAAERENRETKRKRNESWSGKLKKEDVKVGRREKRQKKKEAERVSKMSEEERAKEMTLSEMIAKVKLKNQEKYAQVESKQEEAKGETKETKGDEWGGFND